jgi:hypothetical protein
MRVESSWPVRTSVSQGRASSLFLIDSMIVSKLEIRPAGRAGAAVEQRRLAAGNSSTETYGVRAELQPFSPVEVKCPERSPRSPK